ncbi:shikimate dehydrogenase [Agromyces seonyuensis]|uniref:Shikimate dehydrogenase n=1 Tax=Agromyces seonyuensis TaxID=2662446 RepID=A0A6I4P1V7_9MICO|nr:shikimate dehydrogenase [Agromyces seonyuensis]MWB97227.1 shikimate dehydrogenase [Agromyces seonyuensis]
MTHYLVGLIGEGIGASLTPPMHEREAAALGLDYEYRILDLLELGAEPSDVGRLIADAEAAGFAALNITHPCKQLVMEVVDELHPAAERLGAVNLVLLRDGRRIGCNTDWEGFRDGFVDGLPGAATGSVVQLGAGGAGAATAYALLDLGVDELRLFDYDVGRAAELADRLAVAFPDARIAAIPGVDAALRSADGVVHATPVGMAHHPGVAFDPAVLRLDAWVSDVVYRPLETELLRRAAATGHRVLDGGRMAVGQAVSSIRFITGLDPDAERMRAHFLELVEAEERLATAERGEP